MTNPINETYFISLYLDIRRLREDKIYPVRLRVFTKFPRKQKLFSTKYKMTEKEFKSVWETNKPRLEYKDLRIDLQAIITRAEETAKEIKPFSFEEFERKLFSKSNSRENIFFQYKTVIEKMRENKQFGTADTYELACKSLKDFIKNKSGKEPQSLLFVDISPSWLEKFENYMTEEKGRSITTVSMYLRTLRTLFNVAIDGNDINRELYPFGRRKYQVPAARNIKKALNKETLKILFDAPTLTFEEERAKDFFFFSYFCNGMNIKDIAELKYENFSGNQLQFIRAKTKHTSKSNQKPVVVYLIDFCKDIIKKYGQNNRSIENYIFPFLSKDFTAYENFRKVKNLTISINHNIKKLAKANGIKENISTYAARHSFATNAIRGGASMEYISEALSHSNMKTTQNYFAGFEEGAKKEITELLRKF